MLISVNISKFSLVFIRSFYGSVLTERVGRCTTNSGMVWVVRGWVVLRQPNRVMVVVVVVPWWRLRMTVWLIRYDRPCR